MLALIALLTASAADVCLVGCPHTSIQSAIDAVPPNGVGIVTIEPGVWDGALRIDDGRRITLVPPLDLADIADLLSSAGSVKALENLDSLAPVTITSSANTEPSVITASGGVLNLFGIALDGNLVRALDATDTDVTLFASTVFARGLIDRGGLIRITGGSLSASVASFRDGEVGGVGGLIAVSDAPVTLEGVSLSQGAGGFGACLYVEATATRQPVTLTGAVFRDCTAGVLGGGIYLKGALDVAISDLSVSNSTAPEGGAVALIGPDLVVSIDTASFAGNTAFDRGGALRINDADVTVLSGGFSDNAAGIGAAIAMSAGVLSMQSSIFDGNSSIFDGGAVHVDGGRFEQIDARYLRNQSLFQDGGGLWIGGDAEWSRDIRSLFCANTAGSGGGIFAHVGSPAVLQNLRLLDNVAADDGGGLLHNGSASLTLQSANLLGNSAGRGSGSAALTRGPLFLRDTLIAYSIGGVAVVPRGAIGDVFLGPTAWFANDRGNLDGLVPNEINTVFGDPLLDRFAPGEGCEVAQDWPIYSSPLRDAGTDSPNLRDPDGTRLDIGAYGGPLAPSSLWSTDEDGDGVVQIYDCDEGDPDVNPQADDPPYDGLDSDCRNNDDFDADGDGFRALEYGGTDCKDDDLASYPGAPESPTSAFDQNCDGVLDADLDGFERFVDSDDDGDVDCDDGDPFTYPGAPDDDPNRDRNCDGVRDGARTFQSTGCRTATEPGATLLWLPLVVLGRRRGP